MGRHRDRLVKSESEARFVLSATFVGVAASASAVISMMMLVLDIGPSRPPGGGHVSWVGFGSLVLLFMVYVVNMIRVYRTRTDIPRSDRRWVGYEQIHLNRGSREAVVSLGRSKRWMWLMIVGAVMVGAAASVSLIAGFAG